MKPWSQRYQASGKRKGSNSYNGQLMGRIRKLLEFVSGNDVVMMLKDMLTREEKLNLCDETKSALENLVN